MLNHQLAALLKHPSDRRDRWLRVVALIGAALVNLALLLSVTVGSVGEPGVANVRPAIDGILQVRFIETRLLPPSRPDIATSTKPLIAPGHMSMARPVDAHSKPTDRAPMVNDLTPAPASAPTENAPYRSVHGDFGPAEEPDKATATNEYLVPGANAKVMSHATGNVTYHATRFESSWAPDRENPINKAIDRATVHSVITLPHGMRVDCASGPSSAEPLRTSVPTVALAASNCHGTPAPAAVDAKVVLAIQMLAPAKPLVDRTQNPAVASPSSGNVTPEEACALAHIAGEPPPHGCGGQVSPGGHASESGSAMPPRTLAVPMH